MKDNKLESRRDFIKKVARLSAAAAVGGVGMYALSNASKEDYVWQIDPFKCTSCGRCEDSCVLDISAVKCVHAYALCGYCDLCGGYLKPDSKERNTAAENQLCPTAALKRVYIEDPYYEYEIDEDLCIGCAKCVAGCTSFGNGSLHLQIMHRICVDCNQCTIARVCPSDAISRVTSKEAYKVKGDFTAAVKNGEV
jgi:electron transport complex protein RnfB